MVQHLLTALEKTITTNWDRNALSDFQGQTITYSALAERIIKMHILFEKVGVKPGDKVALCAKNSAEWATTFLGGITYGAVVVPLLHEFRPDNVEYLVGHSEARLLFTEKQIFDTLDPEKMPDVEGIVLMPGLQHAFSRNEKVEDTLKNIDSIFAQKYPNGLKADDVRFPTPDPEKLALINYTSGSMGNSKGVMVTYRALSSNVQFAMENILFLKAGDGMVSMLPLAHMYGLVFEFLFPLCKGAHITFLGRVPSPKVVLKAFGEVKPKLVITVPLVIEKIVKNNVFPALKKNPAKLLLAIPGLRCIVYKKVRKQLLEAFGGNLQELVLGGAAVSSDVEEFLRKIKFPFTVGYGMTECAPLLTYEWWETTRLHSCGRMVDRMEAKVDSPDPQKVPGVLHVRGANVMIGYYKNPEATAEALDADGWLNTGDICTIDADGYVYLRGRSKNMILGPSGQNIYPEEIEVKLNNLPLVSESIVVDRDGHIVALVHPDYEAGEKQGLSKEQIEERVHALLPELNKLVENYSRVKRFEIKEEPFEKTPKQSIRRFMYK